MASRLSLLRIVALAALLASTLTFAILAGQVRTVSAANPASGSTISTTLTATMPDVPGTLAALTVTNPAVTAARCTATIPTTTVFDRELLGVSSDAQLTDHTASLAILDEAGYPRVAQEVGPIPTMQGHSVASALRLQGEVPAAFAATRSPFVEVFGGELNPATVCSVSTEARLTNVPAMNVNGGSLAVFNRQTIAGWADNATTQKVFGGNSDTASTTATTTQFTGDNT